MKSLLGLAIIGVVSIGGAAYYSIISGSKKKERKHQIKVAQIQNHIDELEEDLKQKKQQLEIKDSEIEMLEAGFNEEMESIEREISVVESKRAGAIEFATMASDKYDELEKQHEAFKDQVKEGLSDIFNFIERKKAEINEIENQIKEYYREEYSRRGVFDDEEEEEYSELIF